MTGQSRNFILRNYKTMPIQEIADTLHRPYNQVYLWMRKQGLIEVKQPDYDKFPYNAILKLYIEGWYLEDIAERVGSSDNFCRNVIHRVFRTYNIPMRAAINNEEPDSYTHPRQENYEI